jgi:hypothetical protein
MLKISAKALANHDIFVTSAMRLLHGSIAEGRYCASAAWGPCYRQQRDRTLLTNLKMRLE